MCGLPEEVSDERRFYLNPNYSTKPIKPLAIAGKGFAHAEISKRGIS